MGGDAPQSKTSPTNASEDRASASLVATAQVTTLMIIITGRVQPDSRPHVPAPQFTLASFDQRHSEVLLGVLTVKSARLTISKYRRIRQNSRWYQISALKMPECFCPQSAVCNLVHMPQAVKKRRSFLLGVLISAPLIYWFRWTHEWFRCADVKEGRLSRRLPAV